MQHHAMPWNTMQYHAYYAIPCSIAWYCNFAGRNVFTFLWLGAWIEIGTRGVINSRNRAVLNHLCLAMKIKKINNLITTYSKLALLGSYTVWNARYSTDWISRGYLKPWRATTSPISCTIFPHNHIQYLPLLTYVSSRLMHCHCSASQHYDLCYFHLDTVHLLQFIGSIVL